MNSQHSNNNYVIVFDSCTGCGKCLHACKAKAIIRVKHELCAKCVKYCSVIAGNDLHCDSNKFCIDPNLCTACGDCVEACPYDAISVG